MIRFAKYPMWLKVIYIFFFLFITAHAIYSWNEYINQRENAVCR